ncbi:MAG: BRO family protein [Bacteroidia bacterium]
MEENNKIIIFQEKEVRRVWHNDQWFFVIEDVVLSLTDSSNPKGYVRDMRRRDPELSKGWGQIAHTLSVETTGGKQRMNCANTEGVLRIVQSIPSPKAEPFKQWLAKVGYERIQEIENPELAAQRARQNYKDLGYDEAWIDKRLQSIAIRGQLTDEWQGRGVKEGQEYAILTAEISRATFGVTPSEHKEIKDLQRENLRDHMTDEELIFTMLGEVSTRKEAKKKDAQGLKENRDAAIEGGTAAGDALRAYEQRTGDKVVTHHNFKQQIIEAKQNANKQLPPPPDDKAE